MTTADARLRTKWGTLLDPQCPWPEYPRPQMSRPHWQNLNGLWDYCVTHRDSNPGSEWDGQILVPFCLESNLGGVSRSLGEHEALWYRCRVSIACKDATRQLLHFEAVDYECTVWLNGQEVGSHRGGNCAFCFDVTEAVRSGQNEIVTRVLDKTGPYQLRGKQSLHAEGIWYTPVSGIWQTVWLEEVPQDYIRSLTITTSTEPAAITIEADIVCHSGALGSPLICLEVWDGDTQVSRATGPVAACTAQVPHVKLWSPTTPHLYDLRLSLLSGEEEQTPVDVVESYAGIRSFGKRRDAQGRWRLELNGEFIFPCGPLDQGWWPESLLTPPSDEAMRSDIDFLKNAGFNMIRKHIKVEPRRYYAYCDRQGMLLWQDHVSAGKDSRDTPDESPPWTRLRSEPQDAIWPAEAHEQFMCELQEMVDQLLNAPSIMMWIPFNESWGQHLTLDVAHWMRQRDPSRLLNVASGGNFWPVGDVVDMHEYPHPSIDKAHELAKNPRFAKDFALVLGEFGGHGFVAGLEEHLWSNRKNWGYGGLAQTTEELLQRYITSLENLKVLINFGFAASVYTQTTDVEGEVNGLLTYDRAVAKLPKERLSALHAELYAAFAESTRAMPESPL